MGDDVLADVVQVARHGADHEDTLGLDLAGGEVWPEVHHGRGHRLGCHQHVRHEGLALAELVADRLHADDERSIEDLGRRVPRGEGLPAQLVCARLPRELGRKRCPGVRPARLHALGQPQQDVAHDLASRPRNVGRVYGDEGPRARGTALRDRPFACTWRSPRDSALRTRRRLERQGGQRALGWSFSGPFRPPTRSFRAS